MSIITKKWSLQCRLKKTFYRLYYRGGVLAPSVTFRDSFKLLLEPEASVSIGERTFFNNNCSITARLSVTIGSDCLFGENVKIYDHNHVFKNIPEPIANQGFRCKPVIVGNNVWIGSNVILLPGTEIGDNCVVAAGVVLNSAIPENHLVKRTGEIELIRC